MNDMIPTNPMSSGGSGRQLSADVIAAEIEGTLKAALIVALQHPRDEDAAYGRLCQAAETEQLQEKAIYRYEIQDNEVKGPTVHLMRTFARCWGHIRYGYAVVSDDDKRITLRATAWDMQTGTACNQDASFAKKIFRKYCPDCTRKTRDTCTRCKGTGKGGWIVPNEDELRQLINRHGAMAERNCIKKLVPEQILESIMALIEKNRAGRIRNDIGKARQNIVAAFASYQVEPEEIAAMAGRKEIRELTAEDIAKLRDNFRDLKSGEKTLRDLLPEEKPKATKGDIGDLTAGVATTGEAAKPRGKSGGKAAKSATGDPGASGDGPRDCSECGKPCPVGLLDAKGRCPECDPESGVPY